MEILWIGVGGALGSLARYRLGREIIKKARSTFPISTLIINLAGAVLLGIVTGMKMENSLHLFLAEGFLGAFTTFSTLMYEGFNLIQGKKKMNAAVYMGSSFILGVLGYAAGISLVSW